MTRRLSGTSFGTIFITKEMWARLLTLPFPIWSEFYRKRGVVDWNTYAIVAVIELARDNEENPAIPEWLIEDYYRAIRELAEVGAGEILRTNDAEDVRAILSVLAIAANSRTHARFLLEYSGDELLEIERLAESQS